MKRVRILHRDARVVLANGDGAALRIPSIGEHLEFGAARYVVVDVTWELPADGQCDEQAWRVEVADA